MNKCAIVLGPNNHYTLGLVRCLGEGMPDLTLHCVVWWCSKGEVLLSRYPTTSHFVQTPEDAVEYVLLHFKDERCRPIIFSANDFAAKAIDDRLNELSLWFDCASAGEAGAVVRLMDKVLQGEMAKTFGFRIPKMHVVSKGDPLPVDIEYPVFTKSCRTVDGGKLDEFVCDDKKALENAVGLIKAERFFVSEYIDKKYELNFFGIATEKEVYIPFMDKVHRISRGGYGGYQHFEVCPDNKMLQQVREMILSSGYKNGLFSVEFLVDKNDISYFMEINFRHDGATYRLMPGLNLPCLLCQSIWEHSDVGLNFTPKKRKFVGINEIEDFKQAIGENKESVFRWIIELFSADSRAFINFRDPLPFVYGIMIRFFKYMALGGGYNE